MLVLVVSAITAILLVATTYQAAYSKSSHVKSTWFKRGTVALAVVCGVLMVYSALKQDQSQQKIESAVSSVSATVFPQDIRLEIEGAYEFVPASQGLMEDAQLVISVIPRESTLFCTLGVTHTPLEDSPIGMTFPKMDPPPVGDGPVGFGDPSVQILKFDLHTFYTNGNVHIVGAPGNVVPLVMTRDMTVDDYLQSQFVAELLAPGKIREGAQATLLIKGHPVPFYFVQNGRSWVGSTVFRPTWERYCRSRRPK